MLPRERYTAVDGHLHLMWGVFSQQEIFLLDSLADYILSILEELSSCYQLHFQSHFMLFERSAKHIMQNHKSAFLAFFNVGRNGYANLRLL